MSNLLSLPSEVLTMIFSDLALTKLSSMKDLRLCCTAFLQLVNEQCRTHFAQVGRQLYITAMGRLRDIQAEIKRVHDIILTGSGDHEEQAGMLKDVFREAVHCVYVCSTKAEIHSKWLSFDISLARIFMLCQCFASVMFTQFKFVSPLITRDENDEEDSDEVWMHINEVMQHIDNSLFEISSSYVENVPDAIPFGSSPHKWNIFKTTIHCNYAFVVASFLKVELGSDTANKRPIICPSASVRERLVENLQKWKDIGLVSVGMNNIALILLTIACDLFDNSELSEIRDLTIERAKDPTFAEAIDESLQEMIDDVDIYNVLEEAGEEEVEQANVE